VPCRPNLLHRLHRDLGHREGPV
ncbi:uncharacterized protein METZ01_LOCUS480489, partial [marine metagenome]